MANETVIANLSDVQSLGTLTLAGDVTGTQVGQQINTAVSVNAITFAKFQQMAAGTILGNNTGGTANAQALTPTQILDLIGAVQGDILYRDSGVWKVLPPGTSGQALTTSGAGANPAWANVVTLAAQAANTVYAGPTSGGNANPSFRALVLADLPISSDIFGSYNGTNVLSSNQRLLRFTVPTSMTLPQNLPGSNATSDATATNTTVLTIKKAAAASPNSFSNIGSITFAAGAAIATFTFSSATSFVAGDVIVVDAPGSADATLAGVSITLRGTSAAF